MKKIGLIFALSLVTISAQASDLTGLWCKRYDDFVSVLKIKKDGSVLAYSMGLQAQEIVREGTGYISQGATRDLLMINGQDQNVVEIQIRKSLLGNKTMRLIKSDGTIEKRTACQAK